MDMLIRLYALPAAPDAPDAPDAPYAPASPNAAPGRHGSSITVRRPIGPEHDLVVAWVRQRFGAGWASEARAALAMRPVGLHIALDESPPASPTLLGFSCHDATALGMLGPVGVDAAARGGGVGARLLRASLAAMRAQGYAYAVVGGVGAPGFFARVAGAVPIEGSEPGLYRGMLRPPAG